MAVYGIAQKRLRDAGDKLCARMGVEHAPWPNREHGGEEHLWFMIALLEALAESPLLGQAAEPAAAGGKS